MTQLRSHWTKQNVLLQNSVQSTKSPVSKHTGREVLSDFISNITLFSYLDRGVSGSQSTQLDNLNADRSGKEP
jgi:hypothetical protein